MKSTQIYQFWTSISPTGSGNELSYATTPAQISTVRFYRSEDAIQVLRHFNGFSFRNHKLLVRACQNNAAFGDVSSLEEAAQLESEERRAIPENSADSRTDYDAVWTTAEWKDIADFKK
ncbi:hypothetical protein ANCDUO_22505 [Ancylostoma duodenale]|uniref:RRM domain-containing protein n=1 Tax=Ancylostoma duodenale TaxID=51022 RepID=A0A0C2FL03_9BILA|nr:hypothetical protein ANCDUO_22505 [Ancylostoma duodenale]